MKEPVLIVGAGISGLMAAWLLSDKMQVTIVEAQPASGGRISTISVHGSLVEEGPEFVHGDAAVSLGLLKEAGLEICEVGGKSYKYKNGHLIKEEQTEGNDWDKMIKKLKHLEEDMTLANFLDRNFPLPEKKDFQQEVRGYAEGFDVADPYTASVKALYEEWAHESGADHRIVKGYCSLIEYLEKKIIEAGVNILYNKRIHHINWQQGKVEAATNEQEVFHADKILITIPVSQLAKTIGEDALQFSPALPDHHIAAGNIGFGSVIKVAILFTKKCWPEDAGFMISEEYFRAWWSALPDEKPMLTGWVGGPKAAAITGETDDAIFTKALGSLSAILNISIDSLRENIIGYHVSNRRHQSLAGGAYSFATLASAGAKKILNTPVENTIFFAGEGLYSGPHPGTVEAALVSAVDVAEKILGG
jgi:protoporphyrinogen oxidase